MWYNKISKDISHIPDAVLYYEAELQAAKNDVRITGNIEKAAANMPGVVEQRFNQLQEIEAVLNFLNLQLRKLRRKHFQKYLEAYNRVMTSRDAEKYVDGEDEVVEFEILINEVALLRNKWLGLIKGLESKNFMLGHVAKLRCAGLDDISISN